MQKRLILAAFLFFYTVFAKAQEVPAPASDSLYFENFFSRYLALVETNPSLAIDSLEKIGRTAREKGLEPVISRYHLEKAALHVKEYGHDSAIRHYNLAIQFAKKENSKRELGNAYLALGNYYQFNGNTIAAGENYLLATKLLKDLGRKRALVGLYVNLYIIMNRLQQKNGALANSLSAINADKKNEQDLVKIINASSSEGVGFNFPDQTLVKEAGRDPIYVIFGNAKFAVTSGENMGAYGSFRDVQRIPPGTISHIPDFPRNGSILREITDKYVYVAKDGMLHRVNDFDVMETYGSWDGVYYVPPGSLEKFPKADLRVTMDNRYSVFNFNQEFDILIDSIDSGLRKNAILSNELSQAVAKRNTTLQNRKSLLWAAATGLFALLIIVFLLVRNFRQKQRINAQSLLTLKKEQELLRKADIEKERTRIATDMHDDLGAGLSRIKFLSETIGFKDPQQESIKEDISKIRDYSHEMIDKMGEIVWALNEKNDSLKDLLSYTRAYAVDYLNQNNISCKVWLPEKLTDTNLAGDFRRNIYLSVKEALHNIVKHANAKNVEIHFQTGKELVIIIKDDGVGYKGNKKQFSNGLSNMDQRMSSINGRFSIENKNGTAVTLIAPVDI